MPGMTRKRGTSAAPQGAAIGKGGTRKARTVPSSVCPEIHAALLSLAATRDGFEGLAAALIEAGSDGFIRLMASGDQHGLDGIEEYATGPRRAMQAKRYSDKSALDQTALLGEMARAHSQYPSIDCWILPTTQQLYGKEAIALRGFAETLGWGFVVIDWSEVGPGLPRFAVLCARYPDIAAHWPALAAVRGALDALARTAGFESAAERVLAELRAADVGFGAAQLAATAQLMRIWSDRAAARLIAGPSPALLVEAPPVPRIGLRQAVADWWPGAQPVHALLGGEGMGKTWAALDGVRELAMCDGGPLPLVISSAAAAQSTDGLAAVVVALRAVGDHARLYIDDPDSFWRRRLATWATSGEGTRPRLLVLIDGLDELSFFDWQRWIAPLLTLEQHGLFRLLLTCRPDEWSRQVGLRELGTATLSETAVGLFDAPERDAFLHSRGVDPGQVSDQVLEAALHPRTAYHLTRLAEELGDLTRITREQLLLRDFQNYHAIKGGVMGATEFEALVREMAFAAQQAALAQQAFNVTPGAMLDTAADISGHDRSRMRSVLSDLVNGRWITRDPNDSARLTFTDEGLPDAVGLALAHLVRRSGTAEALAEITRFLEPWGADDLVEKVLRTCATALIVDPGVDDALCAAVLERWRATPEHGSGGRDFWRRLHIFRPELFLHLCEQRGNRSGDWLLEWGVASLWDDHVSARPMVEARLSTWLTRVAVPEERAASLTGDAGSFHQRRRQQRRAATLHRLAPADWNLRIGIDHAVMPRAAPTIAGRVLGFLPRSPFVRLFRDWAVNCAAAGRLTHERIVATLLRENDEDGLPGLAAVRGAAQALEAFGTGLGRIAASHLLRATGAPVDAERAARLHPLLPRHIPPWFARTSTPEGVRLSFAGKRDVAPHFLLGALAEFSADPVHMLDDATQVLLDATVASLSASDVPILYQEDRKALSALMRWHPDRAFVLIRDYLLMRPAPDPVRQVEEIQIYRGIAIDAIGWLTPAECAALADRLESTAEPEPVDAGNTGRGDDNRAARGRWQATALRLAHRPHCEQVALLHAADHWPDNFPTLLSEPTKDEIHGYVRDIDFSAPIDELGLRLRLACALVRQFAHDEVDRDWRPGFGHAEASVRARALELARRSGGERAARQFAATGWSARGVVDAHLAFEGSDLLTLLDEAAVRPLLDRLGAQAIAHLYLHRPALRDAIAPYVRASLVDTLLVKRTSRGFGADYAYYRDRDAAYAIWCADHHDDVVAILEAAWGHPKTRGNVIWDHGDGPTWILLEALARTDPALVKSIWRGSLDHSGVMWMSAIEYFPAQLPAGAAFDDLRSEMLDRAASDERLFNAARELQASGHRAFLLRWIEDRLGGDPPTGWAKAITVAGFLDADDAAVALWHGPLATEPGPGWLSSVWAAASASFEKARLSRYWYGQLSVANHEKEAFRAASVLDLVGDDRVWLFFKDPGLRVDPRSWRAEWLDILKSNFEARRARFAKSLERTWLREQPPSDILHNR